MKQAPPKKRFLLISIITRQTPRLDAELNLAELRALVDTYGGEIVEIMTQRREVHDKGIYIGKGKTQEVIQKMVEEQIDIIVLNDVVKPTQLYDFYTVFQKEKHNIQVWDRVDLILNIFKKHAQTAEAQLQIDLATRRHMGPRIYGMGMELSRQSGMLGTRGIGETNIEIEKRHLRQEMHVIREKLQKLTQGRQMLIDRRKKQGLKTVSLIGYTNAGKTSLYNLLTKKDKPVQNALFVTLDSSVGKLYLQDIHKEILVSDTIGFIRTLPLELVEAFRSTLLESVHSDLLLQVIDITDPELDLKISVVREVLKQLSLEEKPTLYLFNKIDAVPKEKSPIERLQAIYSTYNPQFISVKTGTGIPNLLNAIARAL